MDKYIDYLYTLQDEEDEWEKEYEEFLEISKG